MARTTSWRRICLALLVPVMIAVVVAWQFELLSFSAARSANNSLMVIAPYRFAGTWVFDDDAAGLQREPFVGGVPEMIDLLVADIPNAESGFRLLFAAAPFPGYQKKLTWLRGNSFGNYYELEEPKMEGWICPALFRYYEDAPAELYVKAEPIAR